MERHVDGISLPARPDSVRRAASLRGRRGRPRRLRARTTIDLAAVAASELVTNAVVHGRGPISVRTVLDPASLRVEVQDAAADLPHRVDADAARDGGRGLAIVDAFSQRVGLHRRARARRASRSGSRWNARPDDRPADAASTS